MTHFRELQLFPRRERTAVNKNLNPLCLGEIKENNSQSLSSVLDLGVLNYTGASPSGEHLGGASLFSSHAHIFAQRALRNELPWARTELGQRDSQKGLTRVEESGRIHFTPK